MKSFWIGIIYLVVIGITAFIAGRLLPKAWFRWGAFPYRTYACEQDGNVYRKIAIQKWQSHVPDMSRIFRHLMPPKRLSPGITAQQVRVMVQETCIAEFIHIVLSIASLALLWLCPGVPGLVLTILYIVGNLPFILIQRFNRPKLVRLMKRLEERSTAV